MELLPRRSGRRITHILPDGFAVTDRMIVMQRGGSVAEMATGPMTAEEWVQVMVGAPDDMAA